MNTSQQPDRRTFPRFKIAIPLTFLFSNAEIQETVHATSVNVSLNGIYCTINKYIPVFEKIRVTLLSPAHHNEPNHIILQTDCVVVRIEPVQEEAGRPEYSVVLFFSDLSRPQQDTLQELIQSHAEILNTGF